MDRKLPRICIFTVQCSGPPAFIFFPIDDLKMVNKTVMSVNMECYKCKRMALRSVTEIDGIDSIEFNMKEKTITVVGEADPVCMANLLRRKFKCAYLISHGPPPQKPNPANNPVTYGKPPDVVPILCYPPYSIHGGYNGLPHCSCAWSPCSCRSEIDV